MSADLSLADRMAVAVVLAPVQTFSIFLLTSCASEKVINTITNKITTIFLSDKIAFISSVINCKIGDKSHTKIT